MKRKGPRKSDRRHERYRFGEALLLKQNIDSRFSGAYTRVSKNVFAHALIQDIL